MTVERMNVFPVGVEDGINKPEAGVNQKSRVLDLVLELLQDSQWHTVKGINEELHLPEDKLNKILRFFTEFGFICHGDVDERVKINTTGSEFVVLPLK
jgi:hypothetical protein